MLAHDELFWMMMINKKGQPVVDTMQFESCGEWNNDFVAEIGGSENPDEALAHANRVLDDVNKHVVML